jgi:Dolichyl-phosphate-mannose-protein mannosyltransferase
LLFACSAALLAASVYRAATYSFTGDESLSYAGFTWAPIWTDDANNHLLNTWLMRVCSSLLGDSELSLRLPNLVAHFVYLASVLALLRRFEHTALLLAGFVLFNLNPFLLDFFSLARGYGLASAFTALSLYLLARAFEAKRRGAVFVRFVNLAAASGALAVLSNYAFLNFFLPLLPACAWLLLTDATLRRFERGRLPGAGALFAASGGFLAFVLSELFRLRRIGALYAGGHESFVGDTVRSLARASLYSVSYTPATEGIVTAFVVGLFAALLLLGLGLHVSKREVTLFVPLLLMLASAVALPLVQHRLLGTLFPLDRAALFYLPLYAAVLLSATHLLWRLSTRRWAKAAALALPALLAALMLWHFQRGFNPRSCYLWWFHAHDKEVIEIVEQDHGRHFPGRVVRLANSWMMEPSLNFYRHTRNLMWLEPMTRKPPAEAGGHYVYAFASDVKGLAENGHTVLATYPDTQTVLLRADRAPSP